MIAIGADCQGRLGYGLVLTVDRLLGAVTAIDRRAGAVGGGCFGDG